MASGNDINIVSGVPSIGHSEHALYLRLWGVHPVCKVRRHDHVNQYAANTSARNLEVQLCVQKSAVSASCQLVASTFHQ